MFDAEVTAVFRDSNSHCALRVAEAEGVVHYVAIAEQDGAIQVDLFKMSAREFHHTFKELPGYPVKKAANHFLTPITAAIHVTPAANRVLNSVVQSKELTMNTQTTAGQSNVNATNAASVKTSTKAADKPVVAPVKNKKPTAAQQAAAKKAAAKAKDAAKADAAKAKAKEKEEAAAKKAAAKGKAPPAAVKAAKAKKAADKSRKPTPAKKVAKLVRNPAHAAPAKKGAAPAKKAAKKGEAVARTTYDDAQTLTVIGKENPFRSTLGERFQLIMDKKTTTVGAYVKKTDRRGDLGFFVGKGVLKIK